jgi:hypothetical protein
LPSYQLEVLLINIAFDAFATNIVYVIIIAKGDVA